MNLGARIDRALEARVRLRERPRSRTAAALAAAAARWQSDQTLLAELPRVARLAPEMVAAVIPLAAAPLSDPDALVALADRELGRGCPAGPALIGHVLASNVPALALPAIALACLAGSAVVVKSGRDDPLSAPAFQRALEGVDPELAATVVAAYWPGGTAEPEATLFTRADVVVAAGDDRTMAAVAARVRGRFIPHGVRQSVAAVAEAADVEALALDVAYHDQRGCLSPLVVYVVGDVHRFAERLHHALGMLAGRLPSGPATIAERGARRTLRAAAEWRGARVLTGVGGTVVIGDPAAPFAAALGGRTVDVRPLPDDFPQALPPGAVECVGTGSVELDVEALTRRGVARLCPIGRMQRPALSWPRGQRAPLRSLLGLPETPRLEVET